MKIIKQERGAVLMVAMVMLVILTAIGMAAIQTSVFEMRIARAETRKQAAFYAAEAGLTQAFNQLSNDASFIRPRYSVDAAIIGYRWNADALNLNGSQKVQFLTGNLQYSANQQFNYTVDIWDNTDPDDNLIFARSTATGSTGGTAAVEVMLLPGTPQLDEGTVQIDQQEGSSSEKANVGYDANAMDTSEAGLSRQI